MPDDRGAEATLASLATQVRGIEGDYTDLKQVVLGLDRKIDQSLGLLGTRFDAAISAINTKLDEKNKTPWSVIWGGLGVMFTVLGLVGSLVFLPIKDNQTVLQVTIHDLSKIVADIMGRVLPDNYVSWREHERLIKSIENNEQSLHRELVTRAEHEQHWKGIEDSSKEVRREVSELRAKLDTYLEKRIEGSIWTPRDELHRRQEDKKSE